MSNPHSNPPGRLLPSTTLAIALAGFVLVPAHLLSRPHSCGDRILKCSMQVRHLAQALRAYADQNGGALPPAGDTWADLLIESGLITAEDLVSPMDVPEDRSSFAYVPAERLDPQGKQVLIYEPIELHPDHGIHIAYHDGRIESLPAKDAAAIIARLQAIEPRPTFPPVDCDTFEPALELDPGTP